MTIATKEDWIRIYEHTPKFNNNLISSLLYRSSFMEFNSRWVDTPEDVTHSTFYTIEHDDSLFKASVLNKLYCSIDPSNGNILFFKPVIDIQTGDKKLYLIFDLLYCLKPTYVFYGFNELTNDLRLSVKDLNSEVIASIEKELFS